MGTGVGEAAAAEGATAAKGAGEALTASQIGPATGTVLEAGTAASGATSFAAPGVSTAGLTEVAIPAAAAATGAEIGAANAGAKGPTGKEVLQFAKDAAPIASAASSLMTASANVDAAKNAVKGVTPAVAPPLPQAAIDPDVAEIRKKNALLFGLDSPNATDITGGKAGVGNVGRSTLLGGASSLGG